MIKQSHKFLIVLLLQFTFVSIFSQTTITGVVRDSLTNETLVGANIRLQSDPTVGAGTDIDGAFTLSSPVASGKLIISFVGYKTKEINFSGPGNLNIVLRSESALDEVIVVGYGTQKKSDITGSISSTKNEEFADQPISNIAGSIQGKVSGIDI